jgi:hypothetical protein
VSLLISARGYVAADPAKSCSCYGRAGILPSVMEDKDRYLAGDNAIHFYLVCLHGNPCLPGWPPTDCRCWLASSPTCCT